MKTATQDKRRTFRGKRDPANWPAWTDRVTYTLADREPQEPRPHVVTRKPSIPLVFGGQRRC
jgi:hypothetical protein